MNKTLFSTAILLASTIGLSSAAQALSPTEAYLAYRKALASADTFADLKPYVDKAKFAKFTAEPEKTQKENLGLMKIFIIEFTTKLEVVSEKIDGNNATLETKYCSENKKGTSTIKLVLQDEKWRTLDEEGKVGLEKCE